MYGVSIRRGNSRRLALAGLAACVLATGGCGGAQGPGGADQDPRRPPQIVTCDLRCEWTSEGLIANLSFKNVTDADVKILNRNLLLGDEAATLTWAPFEIAHFGARVPYGGESVNLGAPTAADYHVLAPGEVVDATVNLSKAYNVSAPGSYRIRYASVNLAPDTKKRIDIASNVVQIAKPGPR